MKNIINAIFLLTILVAASVSYAVPVDRNLVLKLDASAVEIENGTVVQWPDASPKGNNMTPTAVEKQPIQVLNAVNGHPAIKFDGVDDDCKIDTTVADDFQPGSEGLTVFVVAKLNSVTAKKYLFRKGNFVSTADQGWAIYTDTVADGRLIGRLNADDISDDDHKAGRYFSAPTGSWFVYTMVIDPNGSGVPATPGSLKCYLNGKENYLGTWYGGVYTGDINPSDSVFLGLGSDVEIAELLVYNDNLTNDELDYVGSYLSSKYDIDTSFSNFSFINGVSQDMILWLDGDSATTTTLGSETVLDEWIDKSGSGNSFEVVPGKTPPAVDANSLNGKTVVSFDGVNDLIRVPSTRAADFNPGTGEFEIIMVVNIKAANAGEYLFRKGNFNSSADQGWSIWLDATPRLISRINTDDISDDDHKAGKTHFLSTAEDMGQWIIYDMRIDADAIDPNEFDVRKLIVDVSGRGLSSNSQTWNGGSFIGTLSPADSVYLGIGTEVDVAEVQVFKRSLDADERLAIGSYLTSKYGIDTAYPDMGNCGLLWFEGNGNNADFNMDCIVDMRDFAEFAEVWMTEYTAL